MKKIILATLISVLTMPFCFSQDIITKKSSDEIKAKVLEVTTTEIKYKKFDNLNGPTFTILKSDVMMIQYENGTKDNFNEPTERLTMPSPFLKGESDASTYYIGYKGAGTVTLVASLISPLIGLIPAIGCSIAPPLKENLGYPNEALFNNPDYHNGYSQKAKMIKSHKVWTNWGIAFGVNLVLVLMIVQSH